MHNHNQSGDVEEVESPSILPSTKESCVIVTECSRSIACHESLLLLRYYMWSFVSLVSSMPLVDVTVLCCYFGSFSTSILSMDTSN